MQPKTIETLRMLGLADELLQQGVKVFDIVSFSPMPILLLLPGALAGVMENSVMRATTIICLLTWCLMGHATFSDHHRHSSFSMIAKVLTSKV